MCFHTIPGPAIFAAVYPPPPIYNNYQEGERRIPGITAREIAEVFKKTPSACFQLIRKLREKGWISQILNTENHREYRLFLTDSGKKIFRDHDAFEQRCYQRSFHRLDGFSEEDFKTYIAIQKCLNESFALDVEESRCNLPANKPDDL